LKPQVIKRQVAWSGRYLQSLVLNYKNSAGDVIEWEAFQRVGCDGIVAVVPFTSDDHVILTKQFRPPVDKYVIEFPAGLNDQNESLEEVAKRELLEETGYEACSLKPVCEGPLSSGASTEVLTVFLAIDIVHKGEQKLDSAEEIEVLKLPYEGFDDALISLIERDTYIDLKVPGLFELAKKAV
jgi:8-oxo-dGTP pyrophosphatase MutT (NUDIX family)